MNSVCSALGDHDGLAKPLHVQQMEQALQLNPILNYVEDLLNINTSSDAETSTDCDTDLELDLNSRPLFDLEGNSMCNGIVTTKAERRADKTRLYNFNKVKKSRKWLKNILLSDSSSDEDDVAMATTPNDHIRDMLRLHQYQRKCQEEFHSEKDLQQYQYYGVGLLSNYDRFYEHQKLIVGPRKKVNKEQKKYDKKMRVKMKRMREKGNPDFDIDDDMRTDVFCPPGRQSKSKKLNPEQSAIKRRKIWISIMKKELPKAQKQKASARKEVLSSLKKIATQCMKEAKRSAIQSQKITKETPTRARRLCKEMQVYWKRFEKVEKEHRKKAEKEALEQRKMDHEIQEMKRQQRKLNFLITQTELYAHFMARKITGASETTKEKILERFSEETLGKQREVRGGVLMDTAADTYDCEEMKRTALKNAEDAYNLQQNKKRAFDNVLQKPVEESNMFANPEISSEKEIPQPSIFNGTLKGYQLKGMTWLANLYNQGINGILADEMGLGKTVQSIAFLSYLAEVQNTWGPFLVVAPASTLHNWQQEVTRFTPALKVVPYWGNTQDRKILRKFWSQEHLQTKNASFHIVITSYQLVIQDVKYFQRIKWRYMILDEAQALKSSASVRWKILLGFNCRNRLLLTGTPIQNSMAELWALLHYIMPTLFDSHDEFNEWFSKDIESHAEKQSGIDENQLSRLHMILKPFMLRRIKKDVENELSDKIEILVYCPLTTRQKLLYEAVKRKISIEDLLQSASSNVSQAQTSTSSLMNLVMQFRKVCNHPELFERRETRSPFHMKLEDYVVPKLVYREAFIESSLPSKQKIIYNLLYIHSVLHIDESLHHHNQADPHGNSSEFSFLRFIDISPGQMNSIMHRGLLVRWLAILLYMQTAQVIQHYNYWQLSAQDDAYSKVAAQDGDDICSRMREGNCLGNKAFLLEPLRTMHFTNVQKSSNLSNLIFTSYQSGYYGYNTHTIHYMPETIAHRKIRCRRRSGLVKSPHSSSRSPTKVMPMSPTKKTIMDFDLLMPQHVHRPRSPIIRPGVLSDYPAYLYYSIPRAYSSVLEMFVSDRMAHWDRMSMAQCGTVQAYTALKYGTIETAQQVQHKQLYFTSCPSQGLNAIKPKHGYSGVYCPDKETLINDAGKLYVLDTLLYRLKREGHRVLIYSQMTRMIDILEEYMWHRKHTYMRLDGSSKISDRRDMVADFQQRSDIFVFLLSTRAGGLGINLTAADTVIFYDSDWNPTVDQQAMDRAHRLGQTKQVTVYRLICKGTIEERILQRAKEKSEIQRMVISGGNFKPDTLKPKEVVSLLLDDEEMQRKLLSKQSDKLTKSESGERKRKRENKPNGKRSGRGPGRPRKIKVEENNVTTAAVTKEHTSVSGTSTPSGGIMWPTEDSIDSACPSPLSAVSVGSDSALLGNESSLLGNESSLLANVSPDDSSNDALVIVDDPMTSNSPKAFVQKPVVPAKRGRGRPRGRPPGSAVIRAIGSSRIISRRPRGRGSVQKAVAAAELAAAHAGKSAGYAAYGYSYKGEDAQKSTGTITDGKKSAGQTGYVSSTLSGGEN